MIGAVLIKPNQAGTVTDAIDAVAAALDTGIAPIPSHRSVETDVPWLADLCWAFGLQYAKLGLLSDFETIQKINRLLRYSAENNRTVPL
jgi:enolase